MSLERLVRPFQSPLQGNNYFPPQPVDLVCDDIQADEDNEFVSLQWGAGMSMSIAKGQAIGSVNVKFRTCSQVKGDAQNSLVNQMLLGSLLYGECDDDDVQIEMTRKVQEHRIENPNDPNQFLEVERIDEVQFKFPKTLSDVTGLSGTRLQLKNEKD